MRSFLPKYKFIPLFIFLFFSLITGKVNAQSATFSLSPGQLCYASGSINTVSAQVISSPTTATSFSWSIQAPSCTPTFTNAVTNGSIINLTYPCCGVYTITLSAYSNTTTLISSSTNTIVVFCSPVISISGSSIVCSGSTGFLSATGASNYTWSSGSTNSTIAVTPTATANYFVIGTTGSCTNIAVQTISVTPIPSLTVSVNNSTVCPGQTAILTASGANSYSWTSGPASFSYAVSPLTSNNYTVIGSIGVCSNIAVQNIAVAIPPTISVVASPSVICSGHTATLIAGGANSYTWTGGIMSPSIAVSPLTVSIYTVLGVNILGCSGTATQIVFVNPSPTLTTNSASSAICPGSSVTLTSAGALSYTWNIGATNSVVAVSPSVTSTYVVQGTNSFGCVDADSISVNIIPPVFAGFIYTLLANGQVNFNNTSINTTSNTSYSWNFGNGFTSSTISPSTTYTSNGIYTVTLIANSGCGPNTITHTVSITNIAGPACASNFTYITGSAGTYSFISTSTGTTSSTTYSWNFGNGTPIYTANATAGIQPPAQTYTNGTFLVVLYIVNTNPSCIDSFGLIINVCTLNANFTHTQLAGNTVNFVSTSTNTLPTTTYFWNYGDGGSGTGANSSHTYSTNGTYIVTLKDTNTFNCTSIKNITITVSSCSLGANFTHTVGTNGAVQFGNASTNTNTLTNYLWNFGDGVYSTAASPTHTYNNAGTYYVKLKINDILNGSCSDSLTLSINVTGISCIANSNFTLTPTGTPHSWNATPAYPYNVTAAHWSWGDGSYSDSLYTTHIYASVGIYTICLSVTVSCGSSSSYCFSYPVSRSNESSSQMAYINVVAPALSTGISNIQSETLSYSIYPNPNNGEFNINLQTDSDKKLTLSVFNLVGEIIYNSQLDPENGSLIKTIHLETAVKGIYFVKLNSETKTFTQKIIISD